MLRQRFNSWAGLFTSVAIGLLAAQPFLRGQLPVGQDTLIHLYRLVQVDALLQQGVFFTRWAADMVHGYGYPLFNYYAPLSYYVAETFRLGGLSVYDAFLVAFVASIVASAVGMYLWGRDLLGDAAGLVASAAYTFMPVLAVYSLTRGVLAERLALAIVPWAFWAVTRLVLSGQRRYGLLAALGYATIILAHNVSGLVFTPVLALYVLALDWGARRRPPHRIPWVRAGGVHAAGPGRLGQTGLALGAGLGLAAFFWLPALAEGSLVQLERLKAWGIFDYRNNFGSLAHIFALPSALDPDMVNTLPEHSLSYVALALAVCALPALLDLRIAPNYVFSGRALRATIGMLGELSRSILNDQNGFIPLTVVWFGLLVFCGSLAMILPISRSVWDAIPLLQNLQFPWRFLATATLALALLAGVGYRVLAGFGVRVSRRGDALASYALLPLVVGGLYVYSLTWQCVPQYYPRMPGPTIEDALRYDQDQVFIGTTCTGEYLPRECVQVPDMRRDEGLRPPRLDLTTLPQGVEIDASWLGALRYDVTLTASEPFTLTFNTLYYAGWRAVLDGTHTGITPTTPAGLIAVRVPAGRHHVQVRFGSTPTRNLADGISLGTLAVMLGLAFLGKWRARPGQGAAPGIPPYVPMASPGDAQSHRSPSQGTGARPCAPTAWGMVLLVLLGLAGYKTFQVDRLKTPFFVRRFDGQSLKGVQIPLQVNYDNQMILLGADRLTPVDASGNMSLTLYWRAPQPTDREYSTSVQLVDEYGVRRGGSDNVHPNDTPTIYWQPNQYGRDLHRLYILPDTPPGRYTLRVSVYPRLVPERQLSVLDDQGTPQGTVFTLTNIELPRFARRAQVEETLNVAVDASVRLVRASLPDGEIAAGATLPVAVWWRASAKPGHDVQVTFKLRDEARMAVASFTLPAVRSFPTSAWLRGDVWRGDHGLRLPAALDSGTYALSIVDMDGHEVVLGDVAVRAPQRLRTAPALTSTTNRRFGKLAALVGYDAPSETIAGAAVSVRLGWQALAEVERSYKSFVHLLDAEGRLVVGSDSVPASWQRPTTGWASGEYILDVHDLSLPEDLAAGDYTYEIGLYDERTLERVPLFEGNAEGNSALVLGTRLRVQSTVQH